MPLVISPLAPSVRSLVRVAGLAIFSLLVNGPRLMAQEKPSGPIIELPKFIVTDDRELPQPESWRYGNIPGFEILSATSDRHARQLIHDFGIFRQALDVVFPVPTGAAGPTTLIICGKSGSFAGFVPPGKGTAEATLASVYLKSREQSAIVIDYSSTTLDLATQNGVDTQAGTDETVLEIDHNKQLYREYVHYLLGRSEPRPPAWLEEGLAQIIMAMKFDKQNIYFGQLEDPNELTAAAGQVATQNALEAFAGISDPNSAPPANAPVEDRDFSYSLKTKQLVPLQEFFSAAHDSPEALNPLGNNRWAKQAYAFVHMCLYGRAGRYQKPFALFLHRISREPVTEAVFQDCFKMSYKKMLDELRGYINFSDYKRQEFNAKKGGGLDEPPPLELRDATQAEIGRIKGEALMLAGHPELAKAELNAAYRRGERAPELLAAIGIFEHAIGEDDHARKFLEVATTAKVKRPGAYVSLAQVRYADALAKPGAADGFFSPAQFSSVNDLLLIARKQPPPQSITYEVMADAWAHSAVKPKKEEIAVLIEGVRMFPTRLKLLYQTAVFCSQNDMNDVAGPLVDYGLKMAPDAKGKAMFEQLKESIAAKR